MRDGNEILPNEKTQKDNTPARAWGRTLSDFWLEGKKGKLHPAEEDLLRCAASGEPCVRGDIRPTTANDQNLIRAELLRFIALGGDDRNPLHDHGVQLFGATIEGSIDFEGTIIPENFGLHNCKISGDIILRDCCAESFFLGGSSLDSIRADRFETNGSLNLGSGFHATNVVRLLGAKIGSDLDCRGSTFSASENSLLVNRASISGHIYLDHGFEALGKVSIEDATIGTGVSCVGGQFRAADQALSFKFSTIDGNVDFGVWKDKEIPDGRLPCTFSGGVSLQRARVSGDLIFTETRFDELCAVNLRNAKIDGQLFWRQIQQTELEEISNSKDHTLEDQPTTKSSSMVSELNLAGASCLTLNMDWDSWKLPSQVRLDHFTYQGFSELPAEWNGNRWIEWLEQQPEHHLNKRFRPHPYQQLSKVLDASGFEDEALKIRMERREKQRIFMRDHEPVSDGIWARGFRKLNNFWRWVQKVFIGHGYRPGMAVIWLFGMIMVGAGIYETAARHGIMTPTHPLIFKEAIWQGDPTKTPIGKIPQACRENWVHPPQEIAAQCEAAVPSEYSSFSSLLYSLDVAIPVVNFRMEGDWSPRVVNWQTGKAAAWKEFPSWGWGWWVRTWEWFQIGAGWALSLLFVSAIGGVIRRD